MSVLFDLVLLILVVLAAPYILFGVVLAKVCIELTKVFYMPLLGFAASTGALAVFTWMHRIPDDARPWQSLVEVISQAHVAGISVPYALAGLAVAFVVGATSKTWRRSAVAN